MPRLDGGVGEFGMLAGYRILLITTGRHLRLFREDLDRFGRAIDDGLARGRWPRPASSRSAITPGSSGTYRALCTGPNEGAN
jgi:hypothetical protein